MIVVVTGQCPVTTRYAIDILGMPELPEVETIRRDLEKFLVGKTIQKFEAIRPKVVGGRVKETARALKNEKITGLERRGKLLIFHLSSKDKFLLIHLKMTGQLILKISKGSSHHPHNPPRARFAGASARRAGGEKIIAGGHNINCDELAHPQNKHTQAIFYFAGARHHPQPLLEKEGGAGKLFFNDLRRFGYIKIVAKKELEKIKSAYGPDALDKNFDWEYFSGILKSGRRSVKAVILDQKKIAGIGNIYADESCFCAKVSPNRPAISLRKNEVKLLYQCIGKILKLAIKHRGTTFRDYCDTAGTKGNFTRFLKVYGREEEKCLRCGAVLIKKKIAGRGSVFCPRCQR